MAGVPIEMSSGAGRTSDGLLAGSIMTLDQAVRNWTAMTRATLGEALFAASESPLAAAGLRDLAGVRPADLVLLDRSGAPRRVMWRAVVGQESLEAACPPEAERPPFENSAAQRPAVPRQGHRCRRRGKPNSENECPRSAALSNDCQNRRCVTAAARARFDRTDVRRSHQKSARGHRKEGAISWCIRQVKRLLQAWRGFGTSRPRR
jgi:hypothetical protein